MATYELVGKRFGKLRVISLTSTHPKRGRIWICLCDCGGSREALSNQLSMGQVVSCINCLKREQHRLEDTPEYQSWCNAKSRCTNPNDINYENYGGRGIRMNPEWGKSFTLFLSDMGNRPSPRHSIDRIDVEGDYCRENCRWATPKEQANNKRNNLHVLIRGESLTLMQFAEKYNMAYHTVVRRYHRGVLPDDIVRELQTSGSKRRGTHNTVKLTPDSVREIRKRYATGNYTQTDLGREYGIRQDGISAVITRRTWKHVK